MYIYVVGESLVVLGYGFLIIMSSELTNGTAGIILLLIRIKASPCSMPVFVIRNADYKTHKIHFIWETNVAFKSLKHRLSSTDRGFF